MLELRAATPNAAARPRRKVQFLCDMYLVELHAGVVDYARGAGWSIFDGKCYDVENLYTEPSDGILAVFSRPRLDNWLRTQTSPIVQMLSINSDSPQFPLVDRDSVAIGTRAAEHFLTLGSPNCVFYQPWLPDWGNACWQTFAATLRAAGRTVHLIDFAATSTTDEAEIDAGTREGRWNWLANQLSSLARPLAVFVFEDRYVNDLFQAAELLGWRIPEDMAVLGADNRQLILGKQPITVSSVDTNLHIIGWEGAALLDRIMNGEEPPAEPIRISPGEVVARQSTGMYVCDHPGVIAAMNYLREHYHEAIDIPQIAQAAGLSARSLQTAFKAVAGRTVSDELVHVRLAHAARLLRDSDLKLESVAQESGLSNANYLCKVFRTAFNATPAAYRETQRAAVRPG